MHIRLFKNAKNIPAILLLLVIVAAMELTGISLVYPLIFLIFDLPGSQIPFIDKMVVVLEEIGFVSSQEGFIVLILFLLFGKAFFALFYRYLSAISVLSYQKKLREEIFLYLFDSQEAKKDQISRIQNALITQTGNASSALQNQFNLIQNVVMSVALLGLGLSLSLSLLLIAVVVGAAVFFALSFTIKMSRKYGEKLAGENQKYVKQITEITDAHQYLKATEGYWRLFESLKDKIRNIYRLNIRFVILNRGTQIFSEPIVVGCLALVIYIGLTVFRHDLALVVIMYVVLTKLYFQIMGGIGLGQAYARDLVSVRYCNKLLGRKPVKRLQKGKDPRERLEGSIEFIDVSVTAEGKRIIEGVTMECLEKEITIISGKTGSGKTTLFSALVGLQRLSKGVIKIGGNKIEDLDSRWFKSQIGLVTQEPNVFSMTVGENLRLRNSAVSDQILEGFLDRFDLLSIFPDGLVNLSTMVDNGGTLLSGGEKQRLALIREIVALPTILLLDEVTSALDSKTTKVVLDELASHKGKMTIVMISHNDVALSYADRVYNLDTNGIARVK
jgi:ATP-binding cassette, subfamily C, bacterial